MKFVLCKKHKKVFFLFIVSVLVLFTIKLFTFYYSYKQFECTNLGDCISFEFVTPSGITSGNISTIVYGLSDFGFNPNSDPPYDIGYRLQKLPSNNDSIVYLFTINLYKPNLTKQVKESVYSGELVPISVYLINDKMKVRMDSLVKASVVEYHDKNIVFAINNYIYEINNPSAFVNLFDLCQEKILSPNDALRFFSWR